MKKVLCSACGNLLLEFSYQTSGFSYRAPTWGVCVFVRQANELKYEFFCPACEHVEVYPAEHQLWTTANAPQLVWHVSSGFNAPDSLFPALARFRSQHQYESGPLKDCVAAFKANIDRVSAIGGFSIRIAGLNKVMSRNDEQMKERLEAVNRRRQPFEWDSPMGKSIKSVSKYRWDLYQHPIPTQRLHSIDHFGLNDLIRWSETHPDVKLGVATLLSTQVALAWSAFEMLATDLWISAVNFRPSLAVKFARSSDKHGKAISIEALSQYGDHDFNLSALMGEVLRPKADFASLKSIQHTYNRTFDKTVAALLKDNLSLLELLRNLIMHGAGRVDALFEEKLKEHGLTGHPACAKIERGQLFPIGTSLAESLIACAVAQGKELIAYVASELEQPGKQPTVDSSPETAPNSAQ